MTPGLLQRLQVRRFLLPAIAAWLQFLGAWLLLFVAQQLVMVGLGLATSWLGRFIQPLQAFPKTGMGGRMLLEDVAFSGIAIPLGLLVGVWVMRRRERQAAKA